MAISDISSYNTRFRISGLATGMDTDQLISDLMRVERVPLDKIMQKRQLAEWKRDEYRDITSLLRGFKDEFFDVLKPDNYMLSQSTYKKFTAVSTDSAYVAASGTYGAVPGDYKVVVNKLATADRAVSSGNVTKALTGTPQNYSLSGKKIIITLDGVTRELTLDNYADLDDLIGKEGTGLQALIDTAFGPGKIIVSNSEGQLKFETTGGASKITLSRGTTDDGLEQLGFVSGSSNRINTNETLENLASKFASGLSFDENNNLVFTINSKTFTFSNTTTLSSMMNTINSDSTANVNIIYDEVTDKFTITAKQTGAGDNIKIHQIGGTFFTQDTAGAARIDTANPIVLADGGQQGEDAEVTINGQTIKRSSNTFNVNGIVYTILKEHTESNPDDTITVAQDVDSIYDKIKKFVDKYNEVIEKINSKLSEKYDRDYQPLTSEQKDVMNEDDIKKWEEKAKTGLLRNDRLLQDIVYNMRKALSDMVSDVGISLSSIGITTGAYSEKGKLKIDETKLKDAIRNDADSVMNLFSKKSAITDNININYQQRAQRYSEEGLAYRLYDIIEDNIRTIRDANGKKGLLLEKAGMQGDASEFKNLIYDEIYYYDGRISELEKKLIQKENRYYQKFAALEKAISQMNAQSNWLVTQFSTGRY
jgi:flagellar hook-associated protein 2